ncbi:hypothetical protein FRC02_000445 [Tulasnella sp. 418]|nr:hypothetical protein FRC02_000445 [Tulasnella sp. 418]
MSPSASISSDAASKALALLLEDFKLREQNDDHSQMIKEPESMREGLERKVKEFELALSAFTDQVRHAIAGVRRQQNTLALIHRLPIEILQYIFLLRASEAFFSQMNDSLLYNETIQDYFGHDIVEDDDDQRLDYRGHNYAVALRLSEVCSHWYHTAVAQPQIWSYLDTRFSLEATELFLERSKGTPLFITCPGNVDSVDESRFMKLIMPHLDRWRAFNSYSKNKALLTNDLPEGENSLPSLESFMIHTSAGADLDVPFEIYERMSRLRELDIGWYSCPFQMGSEVLCGLTGLGIRCSFEDRAFTMRDYELLFTSCPRLQTLSISGVGDCPAELVIFSVKIPNLKSLYFYRLDPRLVTTLLFSLFPDPGKLPVVKIMGSCDPEIAKHAFMDTNREGSFMDLTCRSMAGLSAICFEDSLDSDDGDSGLIQIWGESEGKQSTMLEFAESVDDFGGIAVSLFSPNWTSVLRELRLTTVDDVARDLAPNLHRCPHLEHLIITIRHQRRSLQRVINIITKLAFPDGGTGPATSGPQLKHLSLKKAGYAVLYSMAELLNARHQSTQRLLMDSTLLHRLEKLHVQASKYYKDHDNGNTVRGIEMLLALRGITFEFVEV